MSVGVGHYSSSGFSLWGHATIDFPLLLLRDVGFFPERPVRTVRLWMSQCTSPDEYPYAFLLVKGSVWILGCTCAWLWWMLTVFQVVWTDLHFHQECMCVPFA